MSSLWISGKEKWTFNHYTSVGIVWKGYQTSISWESTWWRTWSGMWTWQSWQRRPSRDYFLSVIRKNNISQKLWVSFYQYSIESILYYCLCVVFSSTAAQRKTLQWIIKTAQETIDCPLPSLEELYRSHCRRKAKNIKKKCTWLNRSHNRSIKASSHQGIIHHLAPCVKDMQYCHTCDGVPMQLCYRHRKEGT